ncbi:MAG: prepilin-type N-terminal cleavage/methylation domain-containing protein [Candidatus Pacebacteria bacterium]|nr:prepilin-type N-terminal cleavage/methylation domain-containing protein [Candidatus Paceibacterota bacterium]
MRIKTKKQGFTLIELLIVIAIIAILAAIIMATTAGARAQARDSHRVSQLGEVRTALEMYMSKNSKYPVCGSSTCTGASWDSVMNALINDGDITSKPKDPINTAPYVYTYCPDVTTGSATKYALMAILETNSPALDNDYNTDYPATGACNCDGSGTADPHQTYCIINP